RPWRHKRKKGDGGGLSETRKRSTPRRCALPNSSGNAHGFHTKLPHLDFARLAKLKAATRIPLRGMTSNRKRELQFFCCHQQVVRFCRVERCLGVIAPKSHLPKTCSSQ